MTSTMSDKAELHDLLREGRAAALAGDTFAARERFRRATERDPSSAEGWVGLSSAVPILTEKREHLLRALALDPQHSEAQTSLAYVERLIAEGHQLAPSQRRAERHASGDASPLLSAPEPPAPTVAVAHCYRHPDRETGLRCVSCSRPICGECAEVTAVGQLCPDCRRARRPRNYQVSTANLIVAGIVALIGAVLGTAVVLFLVMRIPFFGLFLALLAGPFSAELLLRLTDRLTGAKRGRSMQIVVGSGLALGGAPLVLLAFPSLPALILLGYLVLAITTAVTRLK
ncbi:MAG TPA: hypothetical protein VFS21_20575 [Roseiflexaceae bacterium]|nr:hypothetical protein [Roseiflexaceae bacterium]